MQIADQKAVTIHYTLKNDEGTVLDSSKEREPLSYLQGAGNIVPGWRRRWWARRPANQFR